MEFQTFESWVQILESFVVIGGTGFAVYYARSWRKEQLNERQLDLAADLLGRTLMLRESAHALVISVRLLLRAFEGDDRQFPMNLKAEDSSDIASNAKAVGKAVDAVMQHRVRATVLFGREIGETFRSMSSSGQSCLNDLDRLQVQIRLYARFLARLAEDPVLSENLSRRQALLRSAVEQLLGSDWTARSDGSLSSLLDKVDHLELRCSEGLRSQKERDALADAIIRRRENFYEKAKESFRRSSK